MYERRIENYYKNDVLFSEEDLFIEEKACVNLPRVVIHSSNKKWKTHSHKRSLKRIVRNLNDKKLY